MKLFQSPVIFNEVDHTYFYGDMQLSGITGIISRYLFPDKYNNVPAYVLEKARLRGSEIHSQLEQYFLFDGKVPFGEIREEVIAYRELAEAEGLNQISAEYLISNIEEGIATKIDSVLQVDEQTVDLLDYKTTYKVDTEYLSWQLSVNRHLFEIQNPGIRVRNLYGCHLKGSKAKLYQVEHIPEFAIQRLIMTNLLEGAEFHNPLITNY